MREHQDVGLLERIANLFRPREAQHQQQQGRNALQRQAGSVGYEEGRSMLSPGGRTGPTRPQSPTQPRSTTPSPATPQPQAPTEAPPTSPDARPQDPQPSLEEAVSWPSKTSIAPGWVSRDGERVQLYPAGTALKASKANETYRVMYYDRDAGWAPTLGEMPMTAFEERTTIPEPSGTNRSSEATRPNSPRPVDRQRNDPDFANAGRGGAATLTEGEGSNPRGASELDGLLAQERLSATQIARARALIAMEPAARQGDYYETLQGKVHYHSQRDNETTASAEDEREWQALRESGATQWDVRQNTTRIGSIMCNLTTIAMCLEYLGIANPGVLDGVQYPQYEDYLEALRRKEGYASRETMDGMGAVIRKMGADFDWVFGTWTKTDKATWDGFNDAHLRQGKAILMSIGGHIIRVQGVTEEGLLVDDPYGQIQLTPSDGANFQYGYTDANKNTFGRRDTKGEDNVWAWADVEAHAMKWAIAIKA